MSEAPARLWIDPECIEDENDCVSQVKIMHRDVEYIRADLVDGLVEALELMLDWFGYPPDYECWRSDKARAALAALKEER